MNNGENCINCNNRDAEIDRLKGELEKFKELSLQQKEEISKQVFHYKNLLKENFISRINNHRHFAVVTCMEENDYKKSQAHTYTRRAYEEVLSILDRELLVEYPKPSEQEERELIQQKNKIIENLLQDIRKPLLGKIDSREVQRIERRIAETINNIIK